MASNIANSRSEWGSLSIQDRMRLMKDSLDTSGGGNNNHNSEQVPASPLPQQQEKRGSNDSPSTPRRSVVDMWRKREESNSSTSSVPSSPKPMIHLTPRRFSDNNQKVKETTPPLTPKVSTYGAFEEKKEASDYEKKDDDETTQDIAVVVSPPSPWSQSQQEQQQQQQPARDDAQSISSSSNNHRVENPWKQRAKSSSEVKPTRAPSPAGSAATFSIDYPVSETSVVLVENNNVHEKRRMNTQRDTIVREVKVDSFGSGVSSLPSTTASNISSFVGSPTTTNNATTSSNTRARVLDRWNRRSTTTTTTATGPAVVAAAAADSGRDSPAESLLTIDTAPTAFTQDSKATNNAAVEAPPSPAFKDLRSKWDKFGSNKETTAAVSPRSFTRTRSLTPSSRNKGVHGSSVNGSSSIAETTNNTATRENGETRSFGRTRSLTPSNKPGEPKTESTPSRVNGIITDPTTPKASYPETTARTKLMQLRSSDDWTKGSPSTPLSSDIRRSSEETDAWQQHETQVAPMLRNGTNLHKSEEKERTAVNDLPQQGSQLSLAKKVHLMKIGKNHAGKPKVGVAPVHKVVAMPKTTAVPAHKVVVPVPEVFPAVDRKSSPEGAPEGEANDVIPGHTMPVQTLPVVQVPAQVPVQAQYLAKNNATRRQIAARKKLLTKHRRRQGPYSAHSRDENETVGSDSLSQAFDDAIQESLDEKLNGELPWGGQSTKQFHDSPMVGKAIPMQALMAYGEEEDTDPGCSTHAVRSESEYKSFPVSNPHPPPAKSSFAYRNTAEPSPRSIQATVDDCSAAGTSVDGSMRSGMSSQLSGHSMLGSRAVKKLREQRRQRTFFAERTEQHIEAMKEEQRFGITVVDAPDIVDPKVSLEEQIMGSSAVEHVDVEPEPDTPPESAYSQPFEMPRMVNDDLSAATSGTGQFTDKPELSVWTEYSEDTAYNPSVSAKLPKRSASFGSETISSSTSHMNSTLASESTSFGYKGANSNAKRRSPLVAEEFFANSNDNVEAFTTAYQDTSLEQLATDMKEQAGSVLTMDFTQWTSGLNKGMEKASESLNKNISVASESLNNMVRKKGTTPTNSAAVQSKSPIKLPERAPSPVEEVAIEVEYIEDSDPGDEL